MQAWLNGEKDLNIHDGYIIEKIKRSKCGLFDSIYWFIFASFAEAFERRGDMSGMGCISTASLY